MPFLIIVFIVTWVTISQIFEWLFIISGRLSRALACITQNKHTQTHIYGTKDGKSRPNETYLLWSVAPFILKLFGIHWPLTTGPRNQNNKWTKWVKGTKTKNEKRINQVALIVDNSSQLSTISQALHVSFENNIHNNNNNQI